MRAAHRGEAWDKKIKTCRFVHDTSQPPGAQIFLFPLHFLITETFVSSCVFGGGDGVRFRLPLFLSDRQSVPGLGRAVFSYGLRLDIRRAYNICGQMVSSPSSAPLPPSPFSVPSPDSRSPVHSISGLPSSCCIASERRPDPKKLGAPSTSARVLLPVAYPKNIPRLIQPPCAALINNARSGSPANHL